MHGRKAGAAALLHLPGKLAHGLLGDDASFAACQRSFGFIDCGEDFRTGCTSLAFRSAIAPELSNAAAARMPSCYTPPMPQPEMPDEPPPFLGAWPRVYAAVIVYLALVIAACYAFTRFFA